MTSATAPPPRKRLSHRAYVALGVTPLALLFLAAFTGLLPLSAVAPTMYILGPWAGACSILGWTRLDELARESQKFALLWGGSFGLGAAVILLFGIPGTLGYVGARIETALASSPDLALTPATTGVIAGAILVISAQIIGFLICWTGWWIAKR